jgi:sugar O-acyltransferase (sialic acid O-acetyltransferase NeuD family)
MSGTPSSGTDLVIYGAGGMGQEVADLAILAGRQVLGFVDDNPELHGQEILGLPVLGDRSWLGGREVPVFVAVGAPASRRRVTSELHVLGVGESAALVHPTAYVGRGCEVGRGSVVAAAATLTADVHLGRNVIVNAGSTVSHNSRLADFATVAPGAHLAGNTLVGEGADVGIGASVIQGLSIGAWSVVGAGAVVIDDVEADQTVVGCPARVIATRPPGWHL